MIQILGEFVGDEARADQESGCGLSHPEYRALVLKRALKAGPRPGTRAMFLAKRDVDRAMENAGVSVQVPGAMPGRRTI